MLYLAAPFGFRAKMLNRASIADMRWRPISDQTLRIVVAA